MEVDFFHGEDLGVAASRGAAFRPEDRPEGRLADRDDRLRADAVERLTEADRREGLPLPVAGRRRPRHEDDLPLAGLARPVHRGAPAFRDIFALPPEATPREAKARGDTADRPHRRVLS